jgi:NAD(P)-dependent dehydrogenase (short-subunit alcohol dehydrogenase family)
MADLQGHVVAITGASRGLGAALAEGFARAGAKVAICARSRDSLADIANRLQAIGAPYVAEAVDVRREADVERWFDLSQRELGAPRVLVNNASILGPRVPLRDHPLEDWRQVLEVNLTGTLIVTQKCLPLLERAGGGSIINVSSGAAVPPRVNWGAYAVSKDATEGLSGNLARELAGTNIRVNVVDPGAMRTAMRAEAYPEEDPATLKQPASIVPLFLWLASDASGEVTGQRFQADQWIAEHGRSGTRYTPDPRVR